MDFDSLPGDEQDDDSFSDAERNDKEVEYYKNREEANVIQRAGRIKDAWNRCGTWTIYGVWGVTAATLASFFGGLLLAPYLPEDWVNTELIFRVFNWALGASKELFLVVSAYVFGRNHKFVSGVISAITANE